MWRFEVPDLSAELGRAEGLCPLNECLFQKTASQSGGSKFVWRFESFVSGWVILEPPPPGVCGYVLSRVRLVICQGRVCPSPSHSSCLSAPPAHDPPPALGGCRLRILGHPVHATSKTSVLNSPSRDEVNVCKLILKLCVSVSRPRPLGQASPEIGLCRDRPAARV